MRTPPKLLPGELLYSALVRVATRYGASSLNRLDRVDGERCVDPVPVMPFGLASVVRATQDQCELRTDVDALRHPLLGQNTHSKGAQRGGWVLPAIAGDPGSLQRCQYSEKDKADAHTA